MKQHNDSKSYLNHDARATVTVSTTPASMLLSYSISVGGLSLTNRTSTGIVTSREYDALGRIVSTTDGRGNTTAISYDAQGRAAWVEDTFGSRTTYAYDALGRQTAVTNALDHATYTDYDAEGRIVSTWGATYPVTYAYDDFERMVGMTTYRDEAMEEGDTTAWVYDAATGLLTNKVYADGNGPSYTYTPDGRLATRTWARGIVTTYAYDGAGRLSSISYDPDTPDIAYTYDRLGRQLSAVSSVSTNLFVYSGLDLVSETQNGVAIARATDTLGHAAGFSLGAGYAVQYGYDAHGRFQSVVANGAALPSATTFVYSYLAGSDLISGMVASSGHAWTRSYEPARSLIAAVENRFGNTVVSRFDYKNDEIGRRTAIARSGAAFEMPVQDAYGYNARSEVTSARRTLTSDANQEVRGFSYDYAYDPIGNRISATEYDHEDNALVSSYTANELNQYEQRTVPGYAGVRGSATNTATVTVNGNPAWRLGEYFYGGDDADNAASAVMKELETLAVINPPGTNMPDIVQAETGRLFVPKTPEVFTHDDDGNLTKDGRFNYTWDGENRLIAVETRADLPESVPRTKVTYQYDHQSRRIGKTVHHPLPATHSYIYDGWNLIAEATGSNTTHYVWGLDLSGSLQGAGGVGGLLAVVKDSTTYHPASDGNGNVCEYTDASGTIAAHYEYSPFGETVIQSGDMADAFAFRFSTKYWEDEAKLYYYGYRFYAPHIGRWLNRDPIGERGGANLFAGFFNNSVLVVDRKGNDNFWGDGGQNCVSSVSLDTSSPLSHFDQLKENLRSELQAMCPKKPTAWKKSGKSVCCEPTDCLGEAASIAEAYIAEVERAYKARKVPGGNWGNFLLLISSASASVTLDQISNYYPDKLSPGFTCAGWQWLASDVIRPIVEGSRCWKYESRESHWFWPISLFSDLRHTWAVLVLMDGEIFTLDPWESGGFSY
jgi:RHS repeat-associated protein